MSEIDFSDLDIEDLPPPSEDEEDLFIGYDDRKYFYFQMSRLLKYLPHENAIEVIKKSLASPKFPEGGVALKKVRYNRVKNFLEIVSRALETIEKNHSSKDTNKKSTLLDFYTGSLVQGEFFHFNVDLHLLMNDEKLDGVKLHQFFNDLNDII